MKTEKPKRADTSLLRIEKVGSAAVRIYRRTNKKVKRIRKSDGREVIYRYTAFEVADASAGPGKRVLRSFSTEAAARKEAKRIATLIANGDTVAASMRGADAASFARATELLRPTGLSLEGACATVARAVEILNGDRIVEAAQFYARHRTDQITPRTVAEVVDELIATKKAQGKSIRYLGDLRARLGRFAKSYAVEIGSISTGDVQRWLDGLRLSPQSTRNFRTVLHALFAFAESRGYIFKGGNPVAGTETITASGGEIEIYSPQEIASLLSASPWEFVPMLALGAFAGLRSAEAERIEWRDIDLSGGWITVGRTKAKTRSRRLVPVLPNLRAWLSPYVSEKGQVWKGSAKDLQDARAATVKASGIAWKDNALRHSFASYRLAATQDAGRVALECGNSAAMIFKHYRELVTEADGRAWFEIRPEAAANVVQLAAAGGKQ